MAQPYVGEIRMFGGSFNPAGWWMCDGSLLPISEYDTLFQLIGTTYGGDGETNFAVPDLQCRIPIHNGTGPDGTNYQIGEEAGVETVTLTTQQMPQHTHPLTASNVQGSQQNPANNLTAQSHTGTTFLYIANQTPADTMAPAIGIVGGSQPHDNMMPFLCVTFIISLFGIFPSPT